MIVGLEEPHGLALKDELDDYYEQEINHGRLCPGLDGLVDKGLLKTGELLTQSIYITNFKYYLYFGVFWYRTGQIDSS